MFTLYVTLYILQAVSVGEMEFKLIYFQLISKFRHCDRLASHAKKWYSYLRSTFDNLTHGVISEYHSWLNY